MAAELIIMPEAEQEIADAYHWFERCSQGLGKAFLACVDAAMASISRWPESHAKVMDDFRHIKIRRFPYAAYYELQQDTVVVYAVFQAAQDPARLKRNLWLRRPPSEGTNL